MIILSKTKQNIYIILSFDSIHEKGKVCAKLSIPQSDRIPALPNEPQCNILPRGGLLVTLSKVESSFVFLEKCQASH